MIVLDSRYRVAGGIAVAVGIVAIRLIPTAGVGRALDLRKLIVRIAGKPLGGRIDGGQPRQWVVSVRIRIQVGRALFVRNAT